MTNLDSILKSRDITLLTKVHLVKAMVFPVVMYGCESWTVKKAEHWRIDAFELWCWRRLLRVPWAARRSKQSIVKEISSEYWKDWCWGWNSNCLSNWHEEQTHWKRPRCWERLKAGEEDNRGWDGWMKLLTWWTWVWASSRSWWRTGKPGVLQSMGSQRVRHDWATERNRFLHMHFSSWTSVILKLEVLLPQEWLAAFMQLKSRKQAFSLNPVQQILQMKFSPKHLSRKCPEKIYMKLIGMLLLCMKQEGVLTECFPGSL